VAGGAVWHIGCYAAKQRKESIAVAEAIGRETSGQGLATVLVTEDGKTTIADVVVAKIVGIAAREVPGVHELLTQGAGGAIGGLTQRVTRGDTRAQGVRVEVGQREAAVDIKIVVDYGTSVPQMAEAVRRSIKTRVQSMTGLIVTEINIDVADLWFPEDEVQAQEHAATRVE
jgi:uncharacterized alkaline shock family protein YloU